MSGWFEFTSGGGAGFEDSGFFDQWGADHAFADSVVEVTAYGDGYDGYAEVRRSAGDEWEVEVEEGGGIANRDSERTFEQLKDFGDAIGTASPLLPLASLGPLDTALSNPARSEALSDDSTFSLSNSLDDVGAIILNDKLCTPNTPLTSTNYTPHPRILAHQPESPVDPNALYAPITTSHFRTSAQAKAHRRRARLPPKSQALDVARVKNYGRDYWVCRIFNSMTHGQNITDGDSSIHRTRFTKRAAFDSLDLEAAAHHTFDEAIAVHERGWNRPKVYYKNTVRGKLVDISGTSLELRLSRICLVLQQTKSAVDDAVRGGVTLALLCDNPEARRFTKVSNDAGNAKRGERLKQTATNERAKMARQVQQIEVEVESEKQSGSQEALTVKDDEE